MRKLIYIPIIHTEVDMGSIAGPLKQIYVQRCGIAKWRHHVHTVNNMWEGIRNKIYALGLDYAKIKIYQDGLPLCGKELEIMEDVAKLGSHNYNIILGLVKNGSVLIGTEDPRLLIEEYVFIKKFVEIKDTQKRRDAIQKAKKRREELLAERDRFIANRISETLKSAEIGILFSGIEHEIDKYLNKDIKVEFLIYRLPFKELLEKGVDS